MAASTAQPPADIVRLAGSHGLDLDDSSITVNEMGLDFRVAIARTPRGESWVLRIPRRGDVMDRADVEGQLLSLLAPRLTVTVPQWRIQSAELIAYPRGRGTVRDRGSSDGAMGCVAR